MKPILLRKTWLEIAENLDDNPQAMRIVQMINRLSPRLWTFRFSFSRAGSTDLLVDSQPPLSTDEIALTLDGFLEEAFFADEVILYGGDVAYSIPSGEVLTDPPDHNELVFRKKTSSSSMSGIEFIGFGRAKQLPSSFHRVADVARAFTFGTWLGAHRFADRTQLRVGWNLYGQTTHFVPAARARALLGTDEVFTRDLDLFDRDGGHLGSAFVGTSPRLTVHCACTDFGVIDTRLLPASSRFVKQSGDRWFVEIGTSRLMNQYWEPGRSRLIRRTVDAVDRALVAVEQEEAYCSYRADLRRKEKQRAAFALARRQHRAATVPWITYREQRLQTEPSCENEVVVLLGKLEVLGAIPFHQFQLVEYTAKRGIDALARFQIRPEDVPVALGAVEVEYCFENFLAHRHPVEQVNLVICWDFRSGAATDERLSRRTSWLYTFQDGDYLFPVLLLSRVPGVSREERA